MLLVWFEGRMVSLWQPATACGGSHIVIERTLAGSGVQMHTLIVEAFVWSVFCCLYISLNVSQPKSPESLKKHKYHLHHKYYLNY